MKPRNYIPIIVYVCLVFLLNSCYVIRQAGPFLSHHLFAKPNQKLLEDKRTDPRLVTFLKRVEDIRRFASDELGLEDTNNYTKLYELDADYLAAVVQAAPEFSTDPHLFRYPVLGELPYRGFYNPELAKREAEKLEEQGLDVIVRPVDAFSSLGYFRDPLYSFMVDYSASRLAELIIHEQTHATIFIKGESDFNEKLATVIGREGARQYVIERFGESSKEHTAMIAGRHDSEQFTRDMFDLGHSLSAVYAKEISEEEKRTMKAQTIKQFQLDFAEQYEERYDTDAYRDAATMELNNAYLSLFRLYEEPDGRIQRLLEKSGGIKEMTGLLQAELEKTGASPWTAVEKIIER